MSLSAFALRAEYEGTIERQGADGPEEVPVFQGGVLAIGDGDFHVRDQLDAGDGVIVVDPLDQQLADVLRVYPALEEVEAPEGAEPLSPYARKEAEALHHVAALRGLEGHEAQSRDAVEQRLRAHDAAQAAGAGALAAAIAAGDDQAVKVALGDDGLDRLKKDELAKLAEDRGVDLTGADTNAKKVAALRAAGVRREG